MYIGEIIYDTNKGGVHSDFTSETITDEFRELLHACLDEWLNKSDNTGAFWIGDPDYFYSWESLPHIEDTE
jgi:hypothetical protein